MMNQKVENLKGKLIVSCQALPDEPLHSSFIMGRMALAAKVGGASGIRANTKEDIKEIQSQVDLPIIGIVKRDYADSEIYITPTMKEVEELMEVKPEIIAMDATISKRPGNKSLDEFFHEVKEKYPNQLWMADCSTVEEALHADELGFDFIGTTMVGYTKQSKGDKIEANDFEILRKIVDKAKHRVIAAGRLRSIFSRSSLVVASISCAAKIPDTMAAPTAPLPFSFSILSRQIPPIATTGIDTDAQIAWEIMSYNYCVCHIKIQKL